MFSILWIGNLGVMLNFPRSSVFWIAVQRNTKGCIKDSFDKINKQHSISEILQVTVSKTLSC